MESDVSNRPQKIPHPDDRSADGSRTPGQAPFDGSPTPCPIEEMGLSVILDRPISEFPAPDHLAQGDDTRSTTLADMNRSIKRAGRSRSSFLLLWLLSYASAVTLALIWILWTGRTLTTPRPAIDESFSLAQPTAPNLSTTDAPPLPLPPENLIPLGRSIVLGSIEVRPLGIERQHLTLAHSIAPEQSRQERFSSLVLRLRVTNLSNDRPISPLEKFSVRDFPGVPNETFLQTECKRIAMYPLALESEWQIVGQDFPTLRPGESAESLLATAPLSTKKTLGETMTWHARLRVTPHQTNIIGVLFSEADIVDR